jgi:hypothetical protein
MVMVRPSTTSATTLQMVMSTITMLMGMIMIMMVMTSVPSLVDAQTDPPLEYQPYVGWLPVIFNVYPQLQGTAGGTIITITGYRLTGNVYGRLPVCYVGAQSKSNQTNMCSCHCDIV